MAEPEVGRAGMEFWRLCMPKSTRPGWPHYFNETKQAYDKHAQASSALNPRGVYSYFNGFASDNMFFHLVYGRVVQVELARLGLQTVFQQLRVAELGDDVWQGVRRKYWHFPLYFVPVVTHLQGDGADAT